MSRPRWSAAWLWAVVVAAFLLGIALPTRWAPASGSQSPPPGLVSVPTIPGEAVDVRPGVPLPDPVAVEGTATTRRLDPFARTVPVGLGRSEVGSWQLLAGGWRAAFGRAVPSTAGGAHLATVPGTATALVAAVTLPVVADQSGLAFGVRTGTDFLAFVVSTTRRVGAVVEVRDGRYASLLTTAPLALHDGMTLGVRVVGGRVTVLVDGAPVGAVAAGLPGSGVGLFWSGSRAASDAGFDDFEVGPA